MAVPLDDATIRAGVIAHAIRLGKCPVPGTVVSFNFAIKDIDENDLRANRLDKAVARTSVTPAQFTVTESDLAAGRQLINDQEAQYSEPKMTTVKLEKGTQ